MASKKRGRKSTTAVVTETDEIVTSEILADFKSLSDRIEKRVKYLEEKEKANKENEMKIEKQLAETEERVLLNIGGKKIDSTKTTLLGQDDTYFYAMLSSGTWKPDPKSGRYFIDRNPKHIDIILDFLRGKEVDVTDYSNNDLESLKDDLDYYQIKDFPLPPEDFLQDSSLFDRDVVEDWFPGKKFQLIFKYTKDGADTFSKKCHRRGPSIVFIKSTAGVIFGGYNPLHWGVSKPSFDSSAFLFVCNGQYKGLNGKKHKVLPQKKSISPTPKGKLFVLGTTDLVVDANSKLYSTFSTGNNYDSTNYIKVFTDDHFMYEEIEVFLVK